MRPAARTTTTPTRIHIGPENAGRWMTWEEFEKADFQEGCRYELIDGRLKASPEPNLDHDDVLTWLYGLLFDYSRLHPAVINRVSQRARVFVPGRPGETIPQPDLAAYQNYPSRHRRAARFSWKLINPVLVIEVLSPDNHDKDAVRNVALYELVPSIREYWIIDSLDGHDQVNLTVYRRRGPKWQKPINIGMDQEYTTKLLPGFRLRLEPIA